MSVRLFVAGTLALALGASSAWAEVKLPRVFSDHMVLQQKTKAPIWGWAEKGEKVTVSLGDAKAEGVADENGKWKVELSTPAAGGPFELKIAGKNELTVKDVYIGEVWLASGQSNMEWRVKQADKPQEEAAAAKYPEIRMLTTKQVTAETPQDDCEGNWVVCSPETASEMSAVGYFFARELNKQLQVPVGILNSSWGGTICEAWASKPALEADEDFAPILKRSENYKSGNPNQASVLYNSKIHPLVPYAIRGAIWYQGESNRDRAEQYRKLFPAMITDWRKQFGRGDFQFLFVQLAPYKYVKDPNPALENERQKLAELWEAQTATLALANTGMAVTTDISNINDIHPKNKQEVGRRLALWALANTYEKSQPHSGPLYDSSAVEGNKIRLKFKHVNGGLVAEGGKPLSHFTIAGEDLKFVEAKAEIDGETVVVSSDAVAKPTAVRFAWNETAEPNFFNKAGLPASPFRTDKAPLVTAGKK